MNYRQTQNECTGCGATAADRLYNKPEAPQGVSVCPHCGIAAPGWTINDVQRGWRMRPGVKEYYCREAAVMTSSASGAEARKR